VKGFKVGRVFGIDLVIDASWLVIAGLITTSLFIEFSTQDPNRSGRVVGLAAVVGSLLFFGSVLVHELSHSVVARRRGISVRRIRLFIFGGVSEIEQEAATPQDEFVISVVGPVSSLLLAAGFWGLDKALPSIDDPFGQTEIEEHLLALIRSGRTAIGDAASGEGEVVPVGGSTERRGPGALSAYGTHAIPVGSGRFTGDRVCRGVGIDGHQVPPMCIAVTEGIIETILKEVRGSEELPTVR